ncbi:MAG: hypothetical protein E6H87_09905 [Chloroflexi bacterium]|nr:MAG: hypothetical protein E6H87_09905 [Chloroflexota bacterium]
MRRVLTGALLAAVLAGCSVEAPEYRPTPNPSPTVAAKPDILPLTYEVDPLSVRAGTVVAVSKTAIFFSNPNAFVLDWFMTVRFKSADGLAVSDERIGNSGVPPDRADPKFQNWYFPIPPGDSWTVVRLDKTFTKSDVQEFKVARSLVTIGEVDGVSVADQACANDAAVGVIGCNLNVATTATVPGFSKLHLVIIVRSKASSRDVLGALQWRPEIAANAKPWLSLGAGETLKIEMHDGYPAPTVPWEYEVFAHAYQYSSQ